MAADDFVSNVRDDIANDVASAISEHESKGVSDAAPAHEEPREPRQPEERSRGASEERSRTQDRRSTSESTVSEKLQASTSQSQDRQPAPTKVGAEASEPPADWSAKDREAFKRLPVDAQKFLLDRHEQTANFSREYEPVNKIFEPYRDRMRAGGWTPSKLIEGWMGAEKRLLEGDGVNVLADLARMYGIDLNHVAQALGLRPRQQLTDATGQLPPAVAQQLQRIQGRFDAEDRIRADTARRAQTEAEQRVMGEIGKFKSTHPHFDELEADMTAIAHAAIAAKKPVPSLAQLYESALWANPSTREKALAARSPTKGAGNARPAPARARGNGGARSLREELEAAMGG